MNDLKKSDFHYDLPSVRIAQHPAEKRDQSRMMVLHRAEGRWEHRLFSDLPDYFESRDFLVLNNTRVYPARVIARKAISGGKVEVFFLEEKQPGEWDVLMKASRHPKPGDILTVGEDDAEISVLKRGEMGRARVRVLSASSFGDVLSKHGVTPLPPYIQRPIEENADREEDIDRYQTIYAEESGAVAAPTAGLHFSDAVFQSLDNKGVGRAAVTLHVGIGTFRPVQVDIVQQHRMDEERYLVSEQSAKAIAGAMDAGRSICAVGTTTVRTLESVMQKHRSVVSAEGRTELFIYPPYEFLAVDRILTNFHLPGSTLLMMISAFAGREFVLSAYEAAIREEYRFYSYGDCMLIL